ncbi:SDR family NAD(P)-dependent oxidoreductase [uncultured Cedecea sp.]|uniref:SDR family NAD(P)-dependent oxidoreductase n=1 Tax=uncultured Cedecea sp. TaxID=988762 RepID=UPI00262C6377|nr:SDR family NAD(P)-dependent oxidoreductase [uncultured Cedecea sp.]
MKEHFHTDRTFKDKVVIVTGAAQGLGRAYVQALLNSGACVVASDLGTDSEGEGADSSIMAEAARTLRVGNGQLIIHSGQLDDEVCCKELISLAIAHFGRLDILIHNAGWVGYQPVEEQEEDFLERALGINVRAPVWLCKHAWKYLKESSAARIVLNTSDRAMYQRYALPGLTAYAAGKMAQIGIMNALSREGQPQGILVNAISPVAKTRMWGITQPPENLKPEWVVPGVLYLASSLCHDTGVILRASNGQFTATRFCENPGVDYPTHLARICCESIEDIARNWSLIKEFGDA